MIAKDITGNTFIISDEEKNRIAEQAEIDNIFSILTQRFEKNEYTAKELIELAKKINIELENSEVLADTWDEVFTNSLRN